MTDSFTLYCSDYQVGKGKWLFERHEDGMNVLDPGGKVRFWFPHHQANQCFDLPSFWRSVKHITFTTDQGTVLPFDPVRKDVDIVREYLDDALLSGGVEALTRYRTRSTWSLAGGVALALSSLGVLYVLDQGYRTREYARLFLIGASVGVVFFAWGVYGLFRSGRLERRWKRESAKKPSRRRSS